MSTGPSCIDLFGLVSVPPISYNADTSATLWKTLAAGKTSSRRPLHSCRAMISSPTRCSRSPRLKDPFTSTRPLSQGLAGAGSGFEDGRRKMPADIVGGSPARVRDSLTSYLLPFSHPSHRYLDTPPMSHTDSSFGNDRSLYQSHSMPLTPISLPSNHLISLAPDHSTCPPSPTAKPQYIIPLLAALFPYQATHASARAHSLEIITPPSTILHGFYIDSDSTGRAIYVHLPPLPAAQLSTGSSVRDSITALLDLAETLQASHLILVLDRDERDDQSLADLLHSLLYVGMEMCREVPGRYEFDPRQWLLLGIEL